jgi:hypothetical protein
MNGLLSLSNLAAWWAQVAFIVTAALLALWVVRLSAPSIRYTFLRIVLAVCLMLPFIQPRVPASIAPEGRATSASAATVAGDRSAADGRAEPASILVGRSDRAGRYGHARAPVVDWRRHSAAAPPSPHW